MKKCALVIAPDGAMFCTEIGPHGRQGPPCNTVHPRLQRNVRKLRYRILDTLRWWRARCGHAGVGSRCPRRRRRRLWPQMRVGVGSPAAPSTLVAAGDGRRPRRRGRGGGPRVGDGERVGGVGGRCCGGTCRRCRGTGGAERAWGFSRCRPRSAYGRILSHHPVATLVTPGDNGVFALAADPRLVGGLGEHGVTALWLWGTSKQPDERVFCCYNKNCSVLVAGETGQSRLLFLRVALLRSGTL